MKLDYKILRKLLPPKLTGWMCPCKWKPHFAPTMHLGKRMDTAQSASTLGDLKATRKRPSSHMLITGN